VGAPTGTVTFLFTDIEGSTRLWQEAPETMATALERHDLMVGEAIEGHGCYVFSTPVVTASPPRSAGPAMPWRPPWPYCSLHEDSP
jgi:hypothetical protein